MPLFSIVLFQLAYGYTWTCAPMVPVCWWQDVTESIGMLLPLSIEVPDELKRLDRHCLDDAFTKELSKHERIMLSSSTDAVHAHRVCALLGSYMQLNWQPSVVRDCWN